MNKSTTRLLCLLVTGCFLHKVKGQQCSATGTNGIAACQCNFMEACDAQGNPNPNLAQYLPTGVDQLGLVEQGQRNLAYLCEGSDAVVGSVKLLGLNIASDLTWNSHISEVIKKASKRLYFLVQLKRARVPLQDLVLFYTSCVRSVTEYAIPVFYNALPQYLKNELLRIEKRSISIITAGDCAVAQDLGIRPI